MIDKRIVDFIKRHHVLTLATATCEGVPYCAACFYAYDKERNRLIFTSDDATNHAQQMLQNANVAIGITLETRNFEHIAEIKNAIIEAGFKIHD